MQEFVQITVTEKHLDAAIAADNVINFMQTCIMAQATTEFCGRQTTFGHRNFNTLDYGISGRVVNEELSEEITGLFDRKKYDMLRSRLPIVFDAVIKRRA